jgi:asparagine synthase (glutamine-hydrolysing)
MKSKVLITQEYRWKKISRNKIDIFFKGDLEEKHLNILFSLPFKDDLFIQQYINTISINFSIVVSTENSCILAVDHIRSIPIIYASIDGDWYVDCRSSRILSIMDNRDVDIESSLSVAMSGYTIGDKTIYQSIKSLVAGQIIILKKPTSINKIQYYQYIPDSLCYSNSNKLEYELEQVTLNILKKTIDSLNGRQAIIPLSAGYDSRLIASGFKYLGYENVKCYSYGFENYESDTSKIIANMLGYDWKFIRLDIKKEKKFYKSNEFDGYLEFSDVTTSIPVVRWLSTVRIIKESGWADEDAIFINGNSGDFISGGHINSAIYKEEKQGNSNSQKSIDLMLSSFLEKHYNLWGRLYNEQNKGIIKSALLHEYNKLLKHNENISVSAAYESIEYFHRQSKYVVSAQRIYEYYGYEWRLPLWDVEYLKFWSKVSIDLKYKQKLYKDMLYNANWSGVWRIPINKSNIRPKWIIPLRVVAKAIFLIFGGKTYWHKFENSVFKYWMDSGRVTTMFPYSQLILNSDFRGVQALISKRYLESNKILNIFH